MEEAPMDNVLITRNFKRFLDESITINPYMMKKLGLIKNKCLIKTDDYQLACVPFTMSLKGCRVLIILSPKEQEIFSDFENLICMIHMEFQHPDLGRTIPLFLRIRITRFTPLNHSNQCLLDADFASVPRDFKEILIDYYLQKEKFLSCYDSPRYNTREFSCRELLDYGIHRHVRIRFDESKSKTISRIISLSLHRMTVYMDEDETVLKEAPESFLVQFTRDEIGFFLNASIIDYTPSREVEGYFIVRLSLPFSPCLADTLVPRIPAEEEEAPAEPLSEETPAEAGQPTPPA